MNNLAVLKVQEIIHFMFVFSLESLLKNWHLALKAVDKANVLSQGFHLRIVGIQSLLRMSAKVCRPSREIIEQIRTVRDLLSAKSGRFYHIFIISYQ